GESSEPIDQSSTFRKCVDPLLECRSRHSAISIHADSNCRNAAHPSPPALPPAAERLRQSPPTPRHDQRIRPTTQLRHPTSSTHTTIAQPRPFLHTPQLSTHSSPNDRRPFPAPCRHIF